MLSDGFFGCLLDKSLIKRVCLSNAFFLISLQHGTSLRVISELRLALSSEEGLLRLGQLPSAARVPSRPRPLLLIPLIIPIPLIILMPFVIPMPLILMVLVVAIVKHGLVNGLVILCWLIVLGSLLTATEEGLLALALALGASDPRLCEYIVSQMLTCLVAFPFIKGGGGKREERVEERRKKEKKRY